MAAFVEVCNNPRGSSRADCKIMILSSCQGSRNQRQRTQRPEPGASRLWYWFWFSHFQTVARSERDVEIRSRFSKVAASAKSRRLQTSLSPGACISAIRKRYQQLPCNRLCGGCPPRPAASPVMFHSEKVLICAQNPTWAGTAFAAGGLKPPCRMNGRSNTHSNALNEKIINASFICLWTYGHLGTWAADHMTGLVTLLVFRAGKRSRGVFQLT
jgi:hypothetical protein